MDWRKKAQELGAAEELLKKQGIVDKGAMNMILDLLAKKNKGYPASILTSLLGLGGAGKGQGKGLGSLLKTFLP